MPVVADALTCAAPVNAKPSIVKPVAEVSIEIIPLIKASAALSPSTALTPALGPLIVKLAKLIVTFSSYSPARMMILSPAFAAANASAIVA